MARLGRFFIEGQPLYVIQRGNNRQPVFFAEDDYVHYRQWLIAAAADNGLSVHAHVLMTNHIHLLVTPQHAESLPRTMQSLGRAAMCGTSTRARPAQRDAVGRPLPRRADRLRRNTSIAVTAAASRLNPVRAHDGSHPRQYRWSSYRAHAEGQDDALARFHGAFRRLGRSVVTASWPIALIRGEARSGVRRGLARRHEWRLGAGRGALPHSVRGGCCTPRRPTATRTQAEAEPCRTQGRRGLTVTPQFSL